MRALRQAFASDHITLICSSWNLTAAREGGLADEVRLYDYFDPDGWSGRPAQDPALFDAAARGAFDIAVDLRVDGDTRDLLRRVEARMKCGVGPRARFPFLDIVLPAQAKFREELAGEDHAAMDIGAERFVSRLGKSAALIRQGRGRIPKGHVVFGPYVHLPPGRFKVTFALAAQGALAWPTSRLSVEVARDEVLLASVKVRPEDLAGASPGPSLEFDNHEDSPDESLGKFEFRVNRAGWAPGGALQFAGVRLERVGAAQPTSRHRPVELHIGEQLSLLVELIRQRVDIPPAEPAPSPRCAAATEVAALPPGRRIMLAPLSNKTLRDWPLESYARLAGLLLRRAETHVILLGAGAQAEVLSRIAVLNGDDARILSLAGRTSWAELAEVVGLADLVICNNSGIAHLAALHGLPTLGIYSGAAQPVEWGPRGLSVRTLMAEVECSPCGFDRLEDCGHDYRCMRLITPEIVRAHAEAMLAGAGR